MVATKRHRSGLLVLADGRDDGRVRRHLRRPDPDQRRLAARPPSDSSTGPRRPGPRTRQTASCMAQVRRRRPRSADLWAELGDDLPAEGARDRRRVLLHARRRRPAPGARAHARAPRGPDRRRHPRARPPRLPRRPALRARGPPRRPRPGPPARRHRRRRGRARPLRRRRAHAAAHGRPAAQPRLLRARLLPARAARRPDRRALRDAPGGLLRRRRARERRLRPDAARQPALRGRRPACRPGRVRAGARALARATCPPSAGLASVDAARAPLGAGDPAPARRGRPSPAAPVRRPARRDRAGGRAPRRRAARPGAGRRRGDAAAQQAASTPTSTWPCSRPTTAARRRAVTLGPARVGAGAQRALGRRPGLGPDSRRPGAGRRSGGRGARCAWARSTRPSSTTPGWRRERPGTRRWPTRGCAGRWPTTRASHPCTRRGRRRRCGEARPASSPACALALLAPAAPAGAHPLGNFSVNHLVACAPPATASTSATSSTRPRSPPSRSADLPRATVLARKQAEVARALHAHRGRAPDRARAGQGRLSAPPGQGGLPLDAHGAAADRGRARPAPGAVDDETFPDRVGWRAVVARAGQGTAVRCGALARPHRRPAPLPEGHALQPAGRAHRATFAVSPGTGRVTAPRGRRRAADDDRPRAGDGFAGVFADAAAGQGVLLLLMLAAFGWGAVHALSPGHGKTMVAAYLVGTRGTARHAVGSARR